MKHRILLISAFLCFSDFQSSAFSVSNYHGNKRISELVRELAFKLNNSPLVLSDQRFSIKITEKNKNYKNFPLSKQSTSHNIEEPPKKMHLIDLNEDCLLMIFDRLQLLDLIAIAETNEHLYHVTISAARQRFVKKPLKLHGPYTKSVDDRGTAIVENDDFVKLSNLKTIHKVLTLYGHVITNLDVEYRTDSQVQDLNRMINVICSDSLIDYHVSGGFFGFFNHFEKPFKHVQSLSLTGSFDYLGNSAYNLSELFPSICHMSFGDMHVFNDPNGIVGFYPHLVHVELELCDERIGFNETIIQNLITANRHIRSLKLRTLTRRHLKFIADNLQNLEHLKITGYRLHDDDIDAIHFDNLLSFGISFSAVTMPANVHFAKLVDFHTDIQPKKCTRWMDFIENSDTLKRLTVNGRALLSSEIERLAAAHLTVNEVSLLVGIGVEDQTLVEFIKNSQQLTKVHFLKFLKTSTRISSLRDTMYATVQALNEAFSDEWIVSSTTYQIFLDKKIT